MALTLLRTVVVGQISEDAAKSGQITLTFIHPEKVQDRLDQYRGNDTKREGALHQMFLDAGCAAANLSEQPVPQRKQPNVICVLPGKGMETIIVGAHFDHATEGDGIVDN
jgi:hypothetical protein